MDVPEEERIYQLALGFINGVGPVLARNLVSYCGGVKRVFETPKGKLLRIPGLGTKTASEVNKKEVLIRAEQEWRDMQSREVEMVFYLDKEYPYRLKQCHDAPIFLFKRCCDVLNRPRMLAVVGTRKVSPYGRKVCRELIAAAAELNIVLVSGLAYGVDQLAHQQALDSGIPTVGVLAHGLDRIYPSAHFGLAQEMWRKGGGLLTEFPMGCEPDRENFPKRNRIVAGLCDATLVIESGYKGGSMITAKLAHSYDRQVLAIPGRSSDASFRGCNWLIKKDIAALIDDVNDLAWNLSWDQKERPSTQQRRLPLHLTEEEAMVAKCFNNEDEIDLEKLQDNIPFHSGRLAALLLRMEMKNMLEPIPGSRLRWLGA